MSKVETAKKREDNKKGDFSVCTILKNGITKKFNLIFLLFHFLFCIDKKLKKKSQDVLLFCYFIFYFV